MLLLITRKIQETGLINSKTILIIQLTCEIHRGKYDIEFQKRPLNSTRFLIVYALLKSKSNMKTFKRIGTNKYGKNIFFSKLVQYFDQLNCKNSKNSF